MSLFEPVFAGLNRHEVRLDLFARDLLPFKELWQRAELMDVGGVRVPVASIPDLIRLKEMAGRSHDVGDIDALREIEAHRSHREE